MNILIDKFLILILTLAFYIPYENNLYMIIPVLLSITLSCLLTFFKNKNFKILLFLTFLIISFFNPYFIFFIPLICYDIFLFDYRWLWILLVIPLINSINILGLSYFFLISSSTLIICLLKHRSSSLQALNNKYKDLRDTTKEISFKLENQNKELIEKQDYEINLATIAERNRIARDIHDNVGHLLSRSILQIGALLAINKNNENEEHLVLIKDTLSEAMDSIRNSVHDLHEKSIDLHSEIKKLTDNFKFCSIKLEYSIESNIDKSIKHAFIAIVKEGLSNIINHSNSSEVIIKIKELPGIYQLVIQDNGTIYKDNCSNVSSTGIGLNNIKDRVQSINGNINIFCNKGFKIFISVSK